MNQVGQSSACYMPNSNLKEYCKVADTSMKQNWVMKFAAGPAHLLQDGLGFQGIEISGWLRGVVAGK